MTRACLGLLAGLALAVSLAGCVRPAVDASTGRGTPGQKSAGQRKGPKPVSHVDVTVESGHFVVDAPDGTRLIEVSAEDMDTDVSQSGEIQGTVAMRQVNSVLYRAGKPQLVLTAPDATWDGEQLVAPTSSHGERVDGLAVLDGKRTVWTAKTRRLEMLTARAQQFKDGKLGFTANAPRMIMLGDVITMPDGAVGMNAEGMRMQARRATWNLKTGVLEASGDVRVTSPKMRLTGNRLRSNTRLRRLRMSGNARGTLYRQRKPGSSARASTGKERKQMSSRAHTGRSLRSALALVVAVPLGLLAPAPAYAQAADTSALGPVEFRADLWEYDDAKRYLVATGNVFLDNGAGMKLNADKITAQMQEDMSVEWARAEGHVRLVRAATEKQNSLVMTGAKCFYNEKKQTANLEGGARVEIGSPRLAKPAVLTGSRVDANLTDDVYVVHKTASAPAKIHLEPKGAEGQPAPDPVDLTAAKITLNNDTMSVLANGNPLLLSKQERLKGDVIQFTVDKKTNDVAVARADGNVIYDGVDEKGQRVHSTSDHAVFNRVDHLLTLTGSVVWEQYAPGSDKPKVYRGPEMRYKTDTGVANGVKGVLILPRQVKPKPKDGAADNAKKDAAKPTKAGTTK